MKGKLKQTKGITLIALIITIIVLLILAVVSIRLVVNNGILGKAEHATQKYTEEEAAEQEKLLKAEYEMAKYEGKFTGSYDSYTVWKQYGVKIGDYIAYDATKDENGNAVATTTYTSYSATNASSDKNEGRSSGYKSDQVFNLSSYKRGWRVLGIENGQLQLISADIIGPDSGGFSDSTNGNKYYLQGQKGYTDGPDELNAIAGMYGQGKGATGARSINVDDVNKITGYDPSNTGDGKPFGSGEYFEYDREVTYYWQGPDYSVFFVRTDDVGARGSFSDKHSSFNWYDGSTWQSSSSSTTATPKSKEKIVGLTNNFYWYYPTTLTMDVDGDVKGVSRDSKEWEVLFKDTGWTSKCFWLASSCFSCSGANINFSIRRVVDERVLQAGILTSSLYSVPLSSGVRPVVSLKSDIQIEKTETNDGSTLAKACIIK